MPDITLHILTEHESETAEMAGHFKVELLDFAIGMSYRRAVLIFGELFYLAWETEGDFFSFGVFHFGPKSETNDFEYGIRIGNSAKYVAVYRKCHSYLEGGLKDMQPGKCVTLRYGTIQECRGEHGNLSCEIEIGKWKLEGFVSEDMREYLQVCFAICSSEHNSGSRAVAEQQQQRQQQEQHAAATATAANIPEAALFSATELAALERATTRLFSVFPDTRTIYRKHNY
jgi:hypothetical protein